MFANGHRLVMDMAVDALDHPVLRANYDALLLGNLREDVYRIPLVRSFLLGKGLTHYYRPGRMGGVFWFVPSSPRRSNWLLARGVREFRAGDRRSGLYWLGRVVHLLGEMAVPVHVHVVLHWRGEAFEMYAETNHAELRKLPLPPPPDGARTAGQLLHELARETRRFPCDLTRNVPGWLAWRLGLLHRPTEQEVQGDVRTLIPLGAAYTVALYRLFLEAVGVA